MCLHNESPLLMYCRYNLCSRTLSRARGASKNNNAPLRMRLYACSDIHTDFSENMEWLKSLPPIDQPAAVIVSGDVSDKLDVLEKTLRLFQERYEHVFFTPGNHELWVLRKGCHADSIEKLRAVLGLCEQLGVHTSPHRIGDPGQPGVMVVPLLSWHHQSFDTEPDIDGWDGIPKVTPPGTPPHPTSHTPTPGGGSVNGLLCVPMA